MNKPAFKYGIVLVILAVVGVVAFTQLSNRSANAQGEAGAQQTSLSNAASLENAWVKRCNDQSQNPEGDDNVAKEAETHCEIVQRLSIQESGQRLIEFAIGYPEDSDNARGVFILPTGILLEPGVKMSVDDQTPMNFKVRYCLPAGCFAFVNLNNEILDTFRSGSALKVKMTRANGGEFEIPMSLNGFSKAIDELG